MSEETYNMPTKLEDILHCPVFEPTLEEFSEGLVPYLNRAELLVGNAGIFKVVAPKGWNPRPSQGSY